MSAEDRDVLKIGELPHLKIAAINDILFHEEPDYERVDLLAAKFTSDGILRNPPVVAKAHNKHHYLLLDGANRITALSKLGLKDVLVQEIDFFDSGLVLSHWHHAIERFTKDHLLNTWQQTHGLQLEKYSLGQNSMLEPEKLLARVTFSDRTIFALFCDGDVIDKVTQLRKLTQLYKGFAFMDRVSYTDLEHLQRNYPKFCALVSFRTFTKGEIMKLITKGVRMPSGITRIILPKRALHFNINLDILKSKLPVEDKNLWLEEVIVQKIAEKSIRFYPEPTFLFDEYA